MNLRIATLLHDHVLLQPAPELDAKIGTIEVPQTLRAIVANDERSMVKIWNEVAAASVELVGNGRRRRSSSGKLLQGRIPLELEVGQVVLYRRADASPMPDGDTRIVINVASVLGIVDVAHIEGDAAMRVAWVHEHLARPLR